MADSRTPSIGRTGTAKAGTNDARRVECAKSKHHGFHPDGEECPLCEPEPAKPDLGMYQGYYGYFGGG